MLVTKLVDVVMTIADIYHVTCKQMNAQDFALFIGTWNIQQNKKLDKKIIEEM